MARSTALYHPRRGICLMLAVSALGCTENSPSGPEEPEPGPPVLALSSTTAAFTTLAGAPAPAAQTVTIVNEGDGTLSGLTATVAYEPGRPTGWLAATLSATTAPATLMLNANASAVPPASYDATVTVSAPAGGTRTVHVTLAKSAGTAPSIVITSPTRAAMLKEGTFEESAVRITGSVCHDAVPIASLTVNGSPVAVSGSALCEDFDITQSSAWGMSTITVEAVNAYGRRAEHVQSYLRSPEFQVAKAVPDPIANGVFVQLNQPALDDDNPDPDDLASLLEAAMVTPSAVYAALPSPLTTRNVLEGVVPFCTDELFVRKMSLAWDAPAMTLSADTGLDITASATSFSMGMSVNYTGCLGNTTTVSGTISAGSLRLDGSSMVNHRGADPHLTLRADIVDPVLHIDNGAFIDAVTSVIVSTVPFLVDMLVDFITPAAGNALDAAVDEFIAEIALAEIPVHINGRELNVQSAFLEARTQPGMLGVSVESRFAPGAASGGTPPHGSILLSTGAVPVLSTSAFELGTGVAIDAVNQFLWSAWRADAFDITDLAAELGGTVNGISGTASALLPPVVLRSGTGDAFDIGFGELRIAGLVTPTAVGLPAGEPIPITAHVSGQLGVIIGWSGTGLQASTITPVVHVQVDAPDDIIDDTAIATLVGAAAEGVFRNMITDAIAVLPLVDVPIMRLGNVTVGRDGAWITLTGDAIAR